MFIRSNEWLLCSGTKFFGFYTLVKCPPSQSSMLGVEAPCAVRELTVQPASHRGAVSLAVRRGGLLARTRPPEVGWPGLSPVSATTTAKWCHLSHFSISFYSEWYSRCYTVHDVFIIRYKMWMEMEKKKVSFRNFDMTRQVRSGLSCPRLLQG